MTNIYRWVKGHFLEPEILYRLRLNVDAYIRNQILVEMRRGTGTSPVDAILGGVGYVNRHLPHLESPRVRSQGRPVIPAKKRGRRRRRWPIDALQSGLQWQLDRWELGLDQLDELGEGLLVKEEVQWLCSREQLPRSKVQLIANKSVGAADAVCVRP